VSARREEQRLLGEFPDHYAPYRKRTKMLLPFLLCALACLAALNSKAQPAAAAPSASKDYLTRVEAALLLQTLNAELLSHDSASLTLERWCSAHQLATPPRMHAERVHGADKPLTDFQRQQLRIAPGDEIRYRHVRLQCGTVTLSEADNWYVPARLTPEMNRLLESTDTPFGIVVQPLHFQRHTIEAELLWQPLPAGWEMSSSAATNSSAATSSSAATAASGELCFPAEVLQHRALLTLPDGTPFSEVVETYTSNVLAVPRLAPALHHRC
jgi:plastocyanin